jgi:hypothetical protein
VRTVRDAPGSGRDPLQPVPAAKQREALDLIAGSLLAADSLRISPALQRRLGPDFMARRDAMSVGDAPASTDFSLATQVFEMQRAVLSALMSDIVAVHLLDSAEKAGPGADAALPLPELYARLTQAVWGELATGEDIVPLRRELQREHVNRVASLLLHPQSLSRADARGLLRLQAKALAARLDAASRRRGESAEMQAHLKDSADTLNQALSARLLRSGG